MTNAFLASRYPSPEGVYSDLKVMHSAAGYYIGTSFTHTSGEYEGLIEPGSRESEYFATEAEAQRALATETWDQRSQP